jgi:hypothetical protein
MVSHLIKFSLKRLRTHRWLALSQVLGLMAAVALAVAIPMYADAINYDILSTSLSESSRQTRRQPFDFVFRYIGSWYGAITPQQYEPLSKTVTDTFSWDNSRPAVILRMNVLFSTWV